MENQKKIEKTIKTSLIQWFIMLCVIFLLGIGIRLFIGQPCFIPSTSMENAIWEGDCIWLNKMSYGVKLPKRLADVPLFNIFTWIRPLREADMKNNFGYHRLPGYRKPALYDIAVFDSREMEGVLIVKRICGLPGDTVYLEKGRLNINGRFLKQPESVVRTKRGLPVSFPDSTQWTSHDYGPLIVPARGMVISLDLSNYSWVCKLATQEGHDLSYKDALFFCDGMEIDSYVFCQDYYFMLGDNRSNSMDSRFVGFISEQDLVGTINFVLFSYDNSSLLGIAFRGNRFCKIIK